MRLLNGIVNALYASARAGADVRAVARSISTGNPRPIVRRAKNKLVGRALARAGFWRALWK